MQQPERAPSDTTFGPADFAGWPNTVGAERLERAIKYVQEQMSPFDLRPNSGDPGLDNDIFMTAHSMLSPYLGHQINFSVLDESTSDEWLFDLIAILRTFETSTHFACAFLVVEQDEAKPVDEATIGIRQVFSMAKDPDWMGLCVSLPTVKDLHVHAIQSSHDEQAPCAMIAVPSVMMDDDTPPSPGTLEGEMATLESITRWHGAKTFHWTIATDTTAP